MRVSSAQILIVTTLMLTLLCVGCSRKPTSTADIPRTLSVAYSVAVVPFRQPTTTAQLITGHIPTPQGKISPMELSQLDHLLQTSLEARHSERKYAFISPRDTRLPHLPQGHASNVPQALPLWQRFAQQLGTDYLLVPHVLNWHQRVGSRAGVTSPAHVRLEFFLIDSKRGIISKRSIYEEEQTGLANNFLTMGDFFRRKGGWVTAEELAQEGITAAIKDFGL